MGKLTERVAFRWAHTLLPYALAFVAIATKIENAWVVILVGFGFSSLMARVASVPDLMKMAEGAKDIIGKRKPRQKALPSTEEEEK